MSLLRTPTRRDTGAVFARYFVELQMEAERVEEALLRDPGSWLPGLASEANHQGDALIAEVGFGDDARVARHVAIEFGDPVRMPSKTVLPLQWPQSQGLGCSRLSTPISRSPRWARTAPSSR